MDGVCRRDGTARCSRPCGADRGPGVTRVVHPVPPSTRFRVGEGLERPLSQAVRLAEEAELKSWWLSEVTRCLPITSHHPLPSRSGSAHSAVSARHGLPCCACVVCSSPGSCTGIPFLLPPPHPRPPWTLCSVNTAQFFFLLCRRP